jgi:hypothetical protein
MFRAAADSLEAYLAFETGSRQSGAGVARQWIV